MTPWVITKAVMAFAVLLALMIGVLIIGGYAIGQAMGSKQWESRDVKVRQRALGRLLLAAWFFLALCLALGYLVNAGQDSDLANRLFR